MNNDIKYHLPKELKDLLREINKSKYILDLKNSDGSDRYDSDTWENSIDYMIMIAMRLFSNHNLIIDTPTIYPQIISGGICLDFDASDWSLIIYIPNNPKMLGLQYYGGCNNISISGKLKFDDIDAMSNVVYMLKTGIING